jgi:PKD domain/Bacterial Ig-like domain
MVSAVRRRFIVLVAALAVMALWIAPAAQADATWTEIDSVPGQILDVDGNHILFQETAENLAIKNRSTGVVTSITTVSGKTPVLGFLGPHGAILALQGANTGDRYVYEWRDGTLSLLGPMNSYPSSLIGSGTNAYSLTVSGDFAIWMWVRHPEDLNQAQQVLTRLDMTTDATTEVTTSAESTHQTALAPADVASNGDVLFASGQKVYRFHQGVTTEVAGPASSPDAYARDPRTDGTDVVWRTTDNPPHPDDGHTTLVGNFGGSAPGPVELVPDAYRRDPVPGFDYRVVGGWTAYTHGGTRSQMTVRERAPDGTDTPLTDPDEHYLFGLNGDGDVIYGTYVFNGAGTVAGFLREPGGSPIPLDPFRALAPRNGTLNDYVFDAGSHWYNVMSGSLRRLTLDGQPIDGFDTSIVDHPDASDNSSSATFTFSSTAGRTHFQTRLDGGTWEDNSTGTKTYDSLADGQHVFLVRSAEDPPGDVDPEPASQTWTVDTVAPTGVSLAAPANGAATSDPTPAFSGAAGNAAGDGDQVDALVYSGTAATGTLVQTIHGTRSGSTWSGSGASDLDELADGTYTAQARQSDAAGNTTLSDPVTFVLDATMPDSFALTSPTDGAENRSPTLQLRWDAAPDSGTGIDHYELLIDGAHNRDVPTSACSGGSCAVTPQSALTEGEHTWQVKAVDGAGNTRPSDTRGFTVDSGTPGDFSLVSPANGARTGDTTPTFSWQAASDAGAGVDHYDVFVDGSRVGSVSGTEFTPTDALPEGNHFWHVDAVDGADNARSSAERSFFLDTTPPQALIDALPQPAYTGETVQFVAARHDDSDGTVVRYEWDLDGDGSFERDTGADSTTSTTYSTPRDFEVAVRVTDGVGLTNTSTERMFVRLRPPDGLPGVSINHGAQFTNDPQVKVDLVWTPFAKDLVISNDGGFRPALGFPVRNRIPWTLRSSGPERLPRTIYVRFTGGDDNGRQTYQDDIILDETAPVVMSARARRAGRVRVVARDRTSGVKRMQFASNRRHPRHSVRYRRVAKVRGKHLLVRVRDGAGNWSHWKPVAAG